ncbi:pyridoxamine 5'-phosphate oxidase family protein [Streptomyces sp. NPDC050564]|uniref:pyridoxamine 5'-phosphate oxidase family protein n=1 Tax=Streptomyces sp. NPDC050564 TaxID=3365631 RepID=UPI0037ADB7BC
MNSICHGQAGHTRSRTFRTAPDAVPATAAGALVAFEVDHIDEALSQGWSVLVRGRARAVREPDAVERLEALAYSGPWAGGERIEPVNTAGHRIEVR